MYHFSINVRKFFYLSSIILAGLAKNKLFLSVYLLHKQFLNWLNWYISQYTVYWYYNNYRIVSIFPHFHLHLQWMYNMKRKMCVVWILFCMTGSFLEAHIRMCPITHKNICCESDILGKIAYSVRSCFFRFEAQTHDSSDINLVPSNSAIHARQKSFILKLLIGSYWVHSSSFNLLQYTGRV